MKKKRHLESNHFSLPRGYRLVRKLLPHSPHPSPWFSSLLFIAYLHTVATVVLINLNKTMSVFCSEPSGGSLFHLEKKPESLKATLRAQGSWAPSLWDFISAALLLNPTPVAWPLCSPWITPGTLLPTAFALLSYHPNILCLRWPLD